MNDFLLSIIIPVFNEEKGIAPLLTRLLPLLKPYGYELIFIDDGSKDTTIDEIKKYSQKNKQIKLISFQTQFWPPNGFIGRLSRSPWRLCH